MQWSLCLGWHTYRYFSCIFLHSITQSSAPLEPGFCEMSNCLLFLRSTLQQWAGENNEQIHPAANPPSAFYPRELHISFNAMWQAFIADRPTVLARSGTDMPKTQLTWCSAFLHALFLKVQAPQLLCAGIFHDGIDGCEGTDQLWIEWSNLGVRLTKGFCQFAVIFGKQHLLLL